MGVWGGLYLSFWLHRGGRGFGFRRGSHPFFRIASLAVTVSVSALLLSVFVARGFSREIGRRIIGFAGEIRVTGLDGNQSFQQRPIDRRQPSLDTLVSRGLIEDYWSFTQKPGIIKRRDAMHGCLLKGVDARYDFGFLSAFLVRGNLPRVGSASVFEDALISAHVAGLMGIDTGSRLTVYFVEDPPRVRRFRVCGVYDTHFTDFDKLYVYTDQRHLQELQGWVEGQVGGFELAVGSLSRMARVTDSVRDHVLYALQEDGALLRVSNAKERHAALFDWLALQETNARVIVVLMVAVASANLVTALLIMIMERRRQVAILMSQGARPSLIRMIFIIKALGLLLRGLFWGNLIALGLGLSQQRWGWARLNPSEYFLDSVPVEIGVWPVVLINVGVVVAVFFLLLWPSSRASRVDPTELMR